MLSGHDNGGLGEDNDVSIPRGGPLYIPKMVGPVTNVSRFETAIYQELQSLKDELSADSSETWDEEISVDELKIITEDELVAKAFEEAFKAGELAEDVSQDRQEDLNTGAIPHDSDKDIQATVLNSDAGSQNSERNVQAIVPSETLNLTHLKSINNKKPSKKSPRKRMRSSKKKNNTLDEICMAKVEELARIKQKQEDDKASLELHSFKGGCKRDECGAVTTENGDKIRSLKSANVSKKVKCSNIRDNVPMGSPETILCLEVYHNRKKWMKTQEFLVLGSQLLTEAKDKIYCLTDEMMKKTGNYTPSGYFHIEDVFYNDIRDYSCVDYSETILDWLENSKSDALEKWECILAGGIRQHKKNKKAIVDSGKKEPLPSFKAAHMQNTRFCDVEFRLGALYLYCHQGDCRHVIVIRDMRLIHPEDIQNRATYPLIAFQMKFRFKKCSVCKINRARKMTFDDKWAPLNPCYFCEICFYMLHYAKQGTGDDSQVGALLKVAKAKPVKRVIDSCTVKGTSKVVKAGD